MIFTQIFNKKEKDQCSHESSARLWKTKIVLRMAYACSIKELEQRLICLSCDNM